MDILQNRGDMMRVESYKHQDVLHRIWKTSFVLHEDDRQVVIANEDVEVIQPDGTDAVFAGIAITIFPKDEWFNTVCVYRNSDKLRYYYTNIASPVRLDRTKNVITYIDYDLDIITYSDLRFQIVDQDEYEVNQVRYAYPSQVMLQIEQAVHKITDLIHTRSAPFAPEIAPYWFRQYRSLIKGEG
ncbi:DUF402 domain-containing protein [Thermoactinomyces sp. DSM 45892]|uniref:DUF402 domain-containing protein n=1 Tax=Thermoactinomyces sp. DSM 45892 TaxID=1882753 RepID=UPI000B89A331|nr:DUF402 domain-containing protein [Thermoactinomyces sp. DSM 45892]